MHVADELEKLLADVNDEVEVYIHSSKEGEYKRYMCVYVLYPKRSANEIHVFMLDTHSSKGECEWFM